MPSYAEVGQVIRRGSQIFPRGVRAVRSAGNEKRHGAGAFDVWTHTGEGLAGEPAETAGPTLTPSTQAGQGIPVGAIPGAMQHQLDRIKQAAADISKAKGTLATVGATLNALTAVEKAISLPLSAIPFPAFPAIRVTDTEVGLPHAHSHPPNLIPPAPPVPLPSTGPVIPIPYVSGAATVLINGMPAGRCGDMGMGIWCGGYFPMFEIFLGSSSVWIEGMRAARLGVDITKHCTFSHPRPNDPPMGPMVGMTISGSPNVRIGGVPMPSLTSMAIGAAMKVAFKGLGSAIRAIRTAAADAAAVESKEAARAVADAPRGARGPSSLRDFDPEKAGGPIERKSLEDVRITHEGIDQVEAHTSRFGKDASNEAMVARLRAIADGKLEGTVEDRAFYAHELDEYQRYQNLGFKDGLPEGDDAQWELWNNTHTAALEDYGMSETVKDPETGKTRSALYHPSCDPRLVPEGWTPPPGWPFNQ